MLTLKWRVTHRYIFIVIACADVDDLNLLFQVTLHFNGIYYRVIVQVTGVMILWGHLLKFDERRRGEDCCIFSFWKIGESVYHLYGWYLDVDKMEDLIYNVFNIPWPSVWMVKSRGKPLCYLNLTMREKPERKGKFG